MKEWINQAIAGIEADFKRSSDTHLLKVELPAVEGIDLYLNTYYNADGLDTTGFDLTSYREQLETFYRTGLM